MASRTLLIGGVALVIVVIVAVAILMGGVGQPARIIWASTQLNPPSEQAFVKDQLLPPFTEETGVEVEFVAISYSDLATRLEAEIREGRVTIDVIGDLHGGLDLFASKGWLMDLSQFGALEGRTFIGQLEEFSRLYGIKAYVPWMTATYVMVVNKKAFDYLPDGLTADDVIRGTDRWTYEALLEWAKKLYEETGSPKLGFPAAPDGLFVRFLHGYIYPAFTGAQVKNFDSPEAYEMWDYLSELWQYVHPSSTTWSKMDDPLLAEEVWIAWDHTARIKAAIVQKPDQFVVVPAPRGPEGRAFILVVAGLAIPKDAPNPDAAWQLIDYLTKPEVQVKVLENVGFFPTVEEAAGAIPQGPLKIMADGVNAQVSAPDALVSMIPSLGGRGGDFKQIYLTAFEKIVLEGQDPEEVLPQLAQDLMSLFQEVGAPLPPPDQ